MRKTALIQAAAIAAIVTSCGSIARGAPVLSTLVTFIGSNGANPFAGLTADSAGNLYGTTTEINIGGAFGTIYELPVANNTAVTTLATFNNSNGSRPQGNLTIDSTGDLFGTTNVGGFAHAGAVFALNAGSGVITDLTTFVGTNGSNPDGGLVLDKSGILYGTTSAAGNTGGGTAFSIPAVGGTPETTLARFPAGSAPTSRLVVDSTGNIFGTTSGTGTSGSGTVFEIPTSTGIPTTLAAFNGSNGSTPNDLTADSAGNLFGTTKNGGLLGYGTVYEIHANNPSVIDTLASFNGSNGAAPNSGVLIDAAGNLFGTASTDGSLNIFSQPTGNGSIYELAAGSGTITELAAFNGSNGASPFAGLTADSAGILYGTTNGGGNNSDGIIFKITGTGFVVSGPQTITVANGQIYHFTVNTGSGILLRNVPGLTIQAGGTAIVDLATNRANRQLLVIAALSIAGTTAAWTGALDLGNNDLDLPGASLAMISNQIRQGYAGGKWNGPNGITSTSAAADLHHLTALGVIQNNQSGSAIYTAGNLFDGTTPGASDVLVKYTYYGDANLDGKVDGSDYSRIDSGFLSHTTGWFSGDFNYDGTVNGSDYTLIDNAFNSQSASLASSLANPNAAFTSQLAGTAVPEPSTLALTGVACMLGLRRRKAAISGRGRTHG